MKPTITYWAHSGGRRRFGASARCAAALLQGLRPLSCGRLKADTWWLYHVDPARTPPPPPDVTLEPVTDSLIESLRRHPDHEANQLRSGFRFWEVGLRTAYIWIWEGEPLCIQWLLLPAENERLAGLPGWGGMYPPLGQDAARVENLFKFRTRRKPSRDVAVQFEHAMFAQARRRGLRAVYTHIHSDNQPANAFAERAGFERRGWVRRFELDVPGARGKPWVVHRLEGAPEALPVYKTV